MTQKLRRWGWPIPLIGYLLLSAAIAIPLILMFTRAAVEWAFISRSLLSGLPREAAGIAGPFIAAICCYFTGQLLNTNSPASSVNVPRRAGGLMWRLLSRYVAVTIGVYVLVAIGGVLIVSSKALGGVLSWGEIAFGVTNFLLFALLGVFIGLLGARWWLPIIAALLSLIWVYILPLYVADILPAQQYSTGIELLFPGVPAYRHEEVITQKFVLLVLVWVLALSWLLVLIKTSLRLEEGKLRFGLRNLGPTVLMTIGIIGFIQHDGAYYGDYQLQRQECVVMARGMEVCVAAEEAPVLADLTTELEDIATRAEPLLAAYGRVESSLIRQMYGETGSPGGLGVMVLPANPYFGVTGVGDSVAPILAGLGACDFERPEGTLSSSRAFDLTLWIAHDPEIPTSGGLEDGAFVQALMASTQEEINAWMAEFQQKIANCEMGDLPYPGAAGE